MPACKRPGHRSWPTFQNLAGQVVVGSQRTKYRAQAHGRNVEDAVQPRAFARGAGGKPPCASTVTSSPSGKRTLLSSTTTPFCDRPWATMRNPVHSRATDPGLADFITRGIQENSVSRQSKRLKPRTRS